MIIIISGDIGSGKTLFLTRALLRKLKAGYTLYVNYTLKNLPKEYEGKVKIISKDLVGDVDYWKKQNYKKVCIALDEIHNIIDSRRGMVGRNVKVTHWLAQIRKCLKGNKNNHLFCVTQYLHQVDRRLRSLARHHVHCESDEDDLSPVVVEHYKKDSRVEDLWNPGWCEVITTEQKLKIFSYYDTYEMVDDWS